MALDLTKLAVVAQAGGYKVYMYQTNDTIAAVITDGYFDGTYGHKTLNAGDVIIAMCDLDGTPYPCVLIVSVGGSDVTVVAGPPTGADSITITDAGEFTAQTVLENALQEIYQHLLTAKGIINLFPFVHTDAGAALAAFSDGDSATPGYCVTAEGLGIRWNNHGTPTPVGTVVPIPPDFDNTANAVLHVVAAKTGATVGDATKFTVTAFNNDVGALYDADADYGGDSSAMTGDATAKTVQEVTLTLALANLIPYPGCMQITIGPKDGTLGTDDVIMLGATIEYQKKLLTS